MSSTRVPKRLYGALAEAARWEGGMPVGLRQKSMAKLAQMGWVERVRTGESSPQGNRFEVWVLTAAGRDALREYLEG